MTGDQVEAQERDAFLAWRRDLARCRSGPLSLSGWQLVDAWGQEVLAYVTCRPAWQFG